MEVRRERRGEEGEKGKDAKNAQREAGKRRKSNAGMERGREAGWRIRLCVG